MTRELLKKENIREDLLTVYKSRNAIHGEWRLCYIAPLVGVALALFHLRFVWLGVLALVPAAFHAVLLVLDRRKNRRNMAEILDGLDRGEISVSEEILSHIAEEAAYEPHVRGKRIHAAKRIHVFYFRSGGSWRHVETETHYRWSKEFYMTPEGLENTSLAGDTFYVIRLQDQPDVAYIYNKKLFAWEE